MSKTFEMWMVEVDRACEARCGLSIHDLEDVDFYDMFEGGTSAKAAAGRAIRNSMGL